MQRPKSAEGIDYFMKIYYDVFTFYSNDYMAPNDINAVSRVRNSLICAIRDLINLPKVIVIVLDDDIVKSVKVPKDVSETEVYGRIVTYLVKEYHRILEAYKDLLPNKSRKYKFPQVIWIAPPNNRDFKNNNKRSKFASALDTVCKMYDEMVMLEL